MAVPAAAMAARAAAAVAAEWWQEDDEVLLAELHASLEAGRHTAACKSYAVQRAPPRTRRGWYVGARRCETAGPHARMATAVQPRQRVPQALLLLCCSCGGGGGGGGGKRDEVSSYTGMAAGSAGDGERAEGEVGEGRGCVGQGRNNMGRARQRHDIGRVLVATC